MESKKKIEESISLQNIISLFKEEEKENIPKDIEELDNCLIKKYLQQQEMIKRLKNTSF